MDIAKIEKTIKSSQYKSYLLKREKIHNIKINYEFTLETMNITIITKKYK